MSEEHAATLIPKVAVEMEASGAEAADQCCGHVSPELDLVDTGIGMNQFRNAIPSATLDE